MKTYVYCEVAQIGPDSWQAITDVSIVCDGTLLEVMNELGRLGWHMVATTGSIATTNTHFYFELSV